MGQPSVIIRIETAADAAVIEQVTRRAFEECSLGHNGEAELVERLRRACPDAVSLVAEIDAQVVGHILFTPACIDFGEQTIPGMGLAPMSVLPEFQRSGIGSKLVEAGLNAVLDADRPFVIVLGHADFYLRFGFVRASRHGVSCEFPDIPDELFMIRIFDEASFPAAPGTARYHTEFHARDC